MPSPRRPPQAPLGEPQVRGASDCSAAQSGRRTGNRSADPAGPLEPTTGPGGIVDVAQIWAAKGDFAIEHRGWNNWEFPRRWWQILE